MSQKILIVDDSRVSRMMISTIIKSVMPNAEFIEASNGQEALDKLANDAFDLATIDFNMPIMDGLQLAEKLRPNHPNAPIALVTANIQQSTQEKAEALKIDFVGKPISEDKIVTFVKKYYP